MADSKIPDVQAGVEKAVTTLATGLAGGNLIYESAGMFASLLGASFEGFVIDNEMLSLVQRVIRGIEVSDETIGLDVIRDVVSGAGHFLGHDKLSARWSATTTIQVLPTGPRPKSGWNKAAPICGREQRKKPVQSWPNTILTISRPMRIASYARDSTYCCRETACARRR